MGVAPIVFAIQSLLLESQVASPPQPAQSESREVTGDSKRARPKADTRPTFIPPVGFIAVDHEPVRDWKDYHGRSASGRLVAFFGATVFLAVDGYGYAIPLVELASVDRDYVRTRLQIIGKGNFFPGAVNPRDDAATLQMSAALWQKELDTWSRAVSTDNPQESSVAEVMWNHLRAVRDPDALRPLATHARNGTSLAGRLACIDALAAIDNDEARKVLVDLSVTDPHGFIRAAAIWSLHGLKDRSRVLGEYAKYLRSARYREPALASLYVAELVRRPSSQQSIDPDFLDALIDILVVKETRRVPYYVWSAADTGWVPSALGAGGHRDWHFHARTKWAKVETPVPCEMARKMLVEYTGEDRGYNRQEWRKWKTAADTK